MFIVKWSKYCQSCLDEVEVSISRPSPQLYIHRQTDVETYWMWTEQIGWYLIKFLTGSNRFAVYESLFLLILELSWLHKRLMPVIWGSAPKSNLIGLCTNNFQAFRSLPLGKRFWTWFSSACLYIWQLYVIVDRNYPFPEMSSFWKTEKLVRQTWHRLSSSRRWFIYIYFIGYSMFPFGCYEFLGKLKILCSVYNTCITRALSIISWINFFLTYPGQKKKFFCRADILSVAILHNLNPNSLLNEKLSY